MAGVMLMRAYAFTGRSKIALCILCPCFAGLVAIDIWFFCIAVPTLPPAVYDILGYTGCFPDYAIANGNMRLVVRPVLSLYEVSWLIHSHYRLPWYVHIFPSM